MNTTISSILKQQPTRKLKMKSRNYDSEEDKEEIKPLYQTPNNGKN